MSRGNWLAASLLLNFLLAGVAAALLMRQRAPQTAAPTDAVKPAVSLSESVPAPPPLKPVAPARAKTGDWRDWIDGLRAAGVPNNVIAQVAITDFADRWRMREDELQREIKSGLAGPDAFERLAQGRQEAEEEELRKALGEDGFKKWDTENTLHGMNLKINLTAAETNALYTLQKKLRETLADLAKKRTAGQMDDADFGQAENKAQKDFDDEMKALLGNDRYAEAQGMGDDDVGPLKHSLQGINASDDQTASVVQAQHQWSQQRADLDRQLQAGTLSAADYQQQLDAIDAARDQACQQALGTNGYAQLQEAQDMRYQNMKKYADAWNLDDSSIDYVYNSIKNYENSVQAYQQQQQALEQQGQTVDWDAVAQQIEQTSQQNEQALSNYLGADRFNRLQRNGVFQYNQ
jgi:hypothetical protein